MKIDKNTKRIIKLVTLLVVLFVLTGCKIPDTADISLNTTFEDMSNLKSGLFDMFLTYPLAQAINFLASKVSVFWSIVLVTLAINLILLSFTFKSTESMQKMQMLQPELDKIQKKYEGNDSQAAKAQMSQEMQRLFEKNGVNPLSSLSTFLQLPIFLCMYAAIRRSTAVANGTFLGVTLATTPSDGFAKKEIVIIVIYICMVLFQLISTLLPQFLASYKKKRLAKIQHKPYEKPANNNMFMMYGMVILIAFIMLRWPSALSLYYAIVSIINILKTLAVEIIIQRKDTK